MFDGSDLERLVEDLIRLAAIPSIAFPGYPAEPMRRAHDLITALLVDTGAWDLESIELGDPAPAVLATFPGPIGTPTILLYSHYDVQPAGDPDRWESAPFRPTWFESDHGPAIRGRGIADDKANLIAQLGALRVFGGRPPVTVKVLVDSGEECGNGLYEYVVAHPEKFACDAVVISDVGNLRPGEPTLTTSLRGSADVVVEARTLAEPRHSGAWGGPAPDALLALVKALGALHTDRGDVAVAGLRRDPWLGADFTESEYRASATVLDGMPLIGTGSIGERLWSGPAITITALDAPTCSDGAAALVPRARARVNVRCHPAQDAAQAQDLVVRHLRNARPFGIDLRVTPEPAGSGHRVASGGTAYVAAVAALEEAWGRPTVEAACGGSIPFVRTVAQALPGAEILLFGAQDSLANQHGPNERVVLAELAATVVALRRFAERLAGQMF